MRALCEVVAVLLSKNMTCATPVQCNGKRRLSSHFTLHSSHFTLHTSSHLRSCDLFSHHLSSSHLIPSHRLSHVVSESFSQLFSSHPSTDPPFSSPRICFQLIVAVLHQKLLLSAHRSLRHRCMYGVVQLCMGHSPSSLHCGGISLTLDCVFLERHLRVT